MFAGLKLDHHGWDDESDGFGVDGQFGLHQTV